MKGKVGEAMAAGLPVVTTSTGIEGFGLTPGRDVLVADHAQDFCTAVVQLLQDRVFYENVRRAGWKFIRDRFSPDVVKEELLGFFDHVASIPRRPLSPKERLKSVLPYPVRQSIISLLELRRQTLRRIRVLWNPR